jgi:hypothetical protein
VPEKLEACGWALAASGILLKSIVFAVALTAATDENFRAAHLPDDLFTNRPSVVAVAGGLMIVRASKTVAYVEEL